MESIENDIIDKMSTKLEEIESKLAQVDIYETNNILNENNLSNSFDSLNSNQSESNSSTDLTLNQNEYLAKQEEIQQTEIVEDKKEVLVEDSKEIVLNQTQEVASTEMETKPEVEVVSEAEDELVPTTTQSSTLIKRAHLKSLIHEIYNLNEADSEATTKPAETRILVEGFMEKLPPRKNLKNSILLAWKKRYFKLNSIGLLSVHDFDENTVFLEPIETYNLMGARVVYEQNQVISLDDCRGNCVVFRYCIDANDSVSEKVAKEEYLKWKSAIDSQIIDRSDSLWVKPNKPIISTNRVIERNVLIIDIGTCSIRAGLYNRIPQLPSLFIPTCCSKDLNGMVKVGFEAFDTLLSSAAPSTIDLSRSTWSLTSNLNFSCSQLVFPLKNKAAIDKLNVDISSIDAIINYVVEVLNVDCHDHEILIITPQKFSDKLNIQFLNLLLNDEKYQFKSVSLMNQTLMALYSYNASVGVIANLGEKIDIIPICNGISFQGGVTNLVYGGNTMSEYLNSYVSRSHINYVNDMEQYFVRYIKERSVYTSLNYKDEADKYSKGSKKHKIELSTQNDSKCVELPEQARFTSVEGLFNPEIWGIDGQGIHKLIFKAIQSSSMDLRREMARSIFLCGGMSRIPGLKERLEKELKQLLPPTLTVIVNVSDYSYHCAYLGAFRFIQQPEYEKLSISKKEWSTENVNCLRKWRMI